MKCQVKEQYVIKGLIYLPLLSLDTSLHKPVSAVYHLPAIFETEKDQKSHKLHMSHRWVA